MSKDTQLPAELEKEIRDMEDILVKDMKTDNDRNIGYYQGFCEGFNTGAIAYAIKLQTELQATEDKIDKALHAERNKMQKRFTESETEWAGKLHQAQQEIESLKRWKEEAKQLLNPILDYGQSKEANMPLGKNTTDMILERCKRYEQSQQMLTRLALMVSAKQKPSNKFLTEIKTFLDGAK